MGVFESQDYKVVVDLPMFGCVFKPIEDLS